MLLLLLSIRFPPLTSRCFKLIKANNTKPTPISNGTCYSGAFYSPPYDPQHTIHHPQAIRSPWSLRKNTHSYASEMTSMSTTTTPES